MERVILHTNNSTDSRSLQERLDEAGIDYEIVEDEFLRLFINGKSYKINEAIKWIKMRGNN